MAITETRALPAKFIEDLGTDYAKQLTAATAASQAVNRCYSCFTSFTYINVCTTSCRSNSITTTSNYTSWSRCWIISTIFNFSRSSGDSSRHSIRHSQFNNWRSFSFYISSTNRTWNCSRINRNRYRNRHRINCFLYVPIPITSY